MFHGPVTISAGVLKTANSNALGAVTGATFVTNTGVLDINGLNLGRAVVISGVGTGSGAILNSGATQTNALRFVTLAGDTMVRAAAGVGMCGRIRPRVLSAIISS